MHNKREPWTLGDLNYLVKICYLQNYIDREIFDTSVACVHIMTTLILNCSNNFTPILPFSSPIMMLVRCQSCHYLHLLAAADV